MDNENKQVKAGSGCVVLGEQSLVVQCCEMLLEQEYQIETVVTKNRAVVDWCAGHSIKHTSSFDQLATSVANTPIDYLFSITNLKMLPAELLALPSRLAINFHDGPLPAYAGLNAPVWALLNGELQHGVSWHVMTSKVDQGDVLAQKLFPVVPGETVFTLNAKCYQAAIESFTELLDKLASDDLQPRAQDQSLHSYFGLTDRPAAAATIDWTCTYQEIDRMVRALDFGPYPNAVILPRVNLGQLQLLARQSEYAEVAADLPAGTIAVCSGSDMTVATGEGGIRLSRVTDLRGADVDVAGILAQCDLAVGDCLPALDDELKTLLTATVQSICCYESFWEKRLLQAEPLAAPYAQQQTHQASDWRQIEITLPAIAAGADCTTAALALFLGRLGCTSDYTLAYRPLSLQQTDTRVQNYLAAVVPLPVQFDGQIDFTTWQQQFATQVQLTEKRISYLSDFWAREPGLASVMDCAAYPIRLERVASLTDHQLLAPDEQNSLIAVIPDDDAEMRLHYDAQKISEASVQRLIEQFAGLLQEVVAEPGRSLHQYSVVPAAELQQLQAWNDTAANVDQDACVHQLFERQAAEQSETVAFIFEGEQLTYQQLNSRANQLARYLLENGANHGDLIGILLERSLDMVVSLLATLKAGCAYVPLDPVYPKDRLAYMVADSSLQLLITHRNFATMLGGDGVKRIMPDELHGELISYDDSDLGLSTAPTALAYMIYTSGSTGKPKGVMVEHRNVVNFFAGMDQRLEAGPGTWLAVTSISFDISVLEIFWTLSRGLTVVLYADSIRQQAAAAPVSAYPEKSVEFGLFYWNVATDESQYDQNKYKLLLEGAKFGDANGFNSIWTPERHFAAFGGLFPNPAVTSAALATITENLSIRAGSCVVPLHSPIRIAEEWAVVDNLSNGRVALSIAAGWAPPDFAIMPENFADAKNIMFESAETVRKLWRGDTIDFPGPDGKVVAVRTLPRPLQAELPLWVTTAGNIDSYTRAGELGMNVLTHLLGQTIEEVAEKIKAYRAAWQSAGHAGNGTVTVMLHTLVGPDANMVEQHVRQPLKDYLKSAMFLVKSAAWQFPTFKKMSEDQGKTLDEFFETISDEDMDGLLEFAFQRYFHTSGLFGTPESCLQMADKVKAADVDEIACLIDFGIDTDLVLEHLPYLNQLRKYSQQPAAPAATDGEDYSLPALLQRHKVTHFQCTPSMATMLAADTEARAGLAALKQMMVGGEAFPPELATELKSLVGGRVTNMYGPTETTIWSSCGDVEGEGVQSVAIGQALLNQQLHILDENQQRLPIGVAGELVIGGGGVVRGYHNRAELNAQVFLPDPYADAVSDLKSASARMYRTGDLARYLPDGRLECLGRVDHQVKIRGYRVELGEIEALLRQHQTVMEAAVILREDTPGDKRLVAYVRCHSVAELDAATLKAFLKEQLPDFMVPSIFVALHELPLTPNGKIDRKQLPKPQTVAAASEHAKAPENDIEIMLADIWKRALDVPSVGVRDNFFDIGGHSLLIIQVLKELRDNIAKPIQMTDLFKHTTIEALAGFIGSDSDSDGRQSLDQSQARAAARKASVGRRRRRQR